MEENTNSQQPIPVEQTRKPRNLLLIGAIAGAVILILFAFLGVAIGISMLKRPIQQTLPPPSPTPTAIPTQIEIIQNTNPKYATDSALLDLKESLKSLNQEIGAANFFEPEISPPNIELNIQVEN